MSASSPVDDYKQCSQRGVLGNILPFIHPLHSSQPVQVSYAIVSAAGLLHTLFKAH